jgi:transposase InsO family protein
MTRAGRSPVQVGRNVTDCDDGILKKNRYLIHDRDPLDTAQFLAVLGESGIESVKLPPRSPNLNAFAERFVRSINIDNTPSLSEGVRHLNLNAFEFLALQTPVSNRPTIPCQTAAVVRNWQTLPSRNGIGT